MIRPEDVADLQPGDVVELHRQGWSEDVVVRGTVQGDTCVNEFWIGDYSLRSETDQVPEWFDFPGTTLTVVSRAPRPLYVNHPRTKPVPGDVAKDADGHEPSGHTWHYLGDEESGAKWWRFDDRLGGSQPKRLRLLVDGETGRCVQ